VLEFDLEKGELTRVWDPWLHGFNRTEQGILLDESYRSELKDSLGLSEEHMTLQINGAFYGQDSNEIYIVSFKHGSVLRIDQLSGESQMIVTRLNNPHGFIHTPDGWVITNTLRGEVYWLNEQFQPLFRIDFTSLPGKDEAMGSVEWLQFTHYLGSDLYVTVDSARSGLWIINLKIGTKRFVSTDKDWSIQEVILDVSSTSVSLDFSPEVFLTSLGDATPYLENAEQLTTQDISTVLFHFLVERLRQQNITPAAIRTESPNEIRKLFQQQVQAQFDADREHLTTLLSAHTSLVLDGLLDEASIERVAALVTDRFVDEMITSAKMVSQTPSAFEATLDDKPIVAIIGGIRREGLAISAGAAQIGIPLLWARPEWVQPSSTTRLALEQAISVSWVAGKLVATHHLFIEPLALDAYDDRSGKIAQNYPNSVRLSSSRMQSAMASKAVLSEAFQVHGVPMPQTAIIRSKGDIEATLTSWVSAGHESVVVKPSEGSHGSGVRLFTSGDPLEKVADYIAELMTHGLLNGFLPPQQQVLLQEDAHGVMLMHEDGTLRKFDVGIYIAMREDGRREAIFSYVKFAPEGGFITNGTIYEWDETTAQVMRRKFSNLADITQIKPVRIIPGEEPVAVTQEEWIAWIRQMEAAAIGAGDAIEKATEEPVYFYRADVAPTFMNGQKGVVVFEINRQPMGSWNLAHQFSVWPYNALLTSPFYIQATLNGALRRMFQPEDSEDIEEHLHAFAQTADDL